jgi:uncharacterized protein (DUF433 family)
MPRGQAKQQFSARFGQALLGRLRERSSMTGTPQTALAERYIDEGLRMDEHPGIHFRDGGAGRRPAVLGTRLDVAQVIDTLRQNRNSIEETAEYLDLTPAQVEAAVRYYAAFTDEVAEWIEQGLAIAERERELRLRQDQVLAG